jgi:hypothetical protein
MRAFLLLISYQIQQQQKERRDVVEAQRKHGQKSQD